MKVRVKVHRQGGPANEITFELSSPPFSMEKVSEVYPDFSASNIIVCIAASIKPDQFEPLMKIESDCICIAGLRL